MLFVCFQNLETFESLVSTLSSSISSPAFFRRLFDDFSLDFPLVPLFFFLFLSFTMFVFFDMSFWILSSFSVSDLNHRNHMNIFDSASHLDIWLCFFWTELL